MAKLKKYEQTLKIKTGLKETFDQVAELRNFLVIFRFIKNVIERSVDKSLRKYGLLNGKETPDAVIYVPAKIICE
ncbi:MAG: hypothetical protein ABI416_15045 [Ginsengibacter sp.]